MNEQIRINQTVRVPINYEDHCLPESVKEFKPVVFQDGSTYCCLSNGDTQKRISGCGETTEMAIADWDQSLRQSLSGEDDNCLYPDMHLSGIEHH